MGLVGVEWNIAGFLATELSEAQIGEELGGFFSEVDPDFVVLQEVQFFSSPRGSSATYISELCGLPFVAEHAFDLSHLDPSGCMGVAIVSKYPMSDFVVKYFEDNNTNRARRTGIRFLSKGGVAATLETDDGPVKVGNTHFHYPYEEVDFTSETEMQEDFVRQILSGDRCSPNEHTLKKMGQNFAPACLSIRRKNSSKL